MRHLIVIASCALALTGCTSTITMRHPDGRVATCGDSWAFGANHFAAAERDRACVNDYQVQGFARAPR